MLEGLFVEGTDLAGQDLGEVGVDADLGTEVARKDIEPEELDELAVGVLFEADAFLELVEVALDRALEFVLEERELFDQAFLVEFGLQLEEVAELLVAVGLEVVLELVTKLGGVGGDFLGDLAFQAAPLLLQVDLADVGEAAFEHLERLEEALDLAEVVVGLRASDSLELRVFEFGYVSLQLA